MPWKNLEAFLTRLLEIDSIRDIRLATKALMGLPQHWLAPETVEGVGRVASIARERGVHLAVHTHVNAAQSLTPLVARAARALTDAGAVPVRLGPEVLRASTAGPVALAEARLRRQVGRDLLGRRLPVRRLLLGRLGALLGLDCLRGLGRGDGFLRHLVRQNGDIGRRQCGHLDVAVVFTAGHRAEQAGDLRRVLAFADGDDDQDGMVAQ